MNANRMQLKVKVSCSFHNKIECKTTANMNDNRNHNDSQNKHQTSRNGSSQITEDTNADNIGS